MFQGFSPRTMDFIWGIRLNNDKVWFEAHREDFRRDFQEPMKELGAAVLALVQARCPGHAFRFRLSRIYRDARRLRGRGMYRDSLWFTLETPGAADTPGPAFWFELTPEEWSYGMGYYMAAPQTMAKLRARITRAPAAFQKLIAPIEKQGEFSLDGPEYARGKDAPCEQLRAWYQKKSFALGHVQPCGEELYSPELTQRLAGGYALLMPVYDYLRTLESDMSPAENK